MRSGTPSHAVFVVALGSAVTACGNEDLFVPELTSTERLIEREASARWAKDDQAIERIVVVGDLDGDGIDDALVRSYWWVEFPDASSFVEAAVYVRYGGAPTGKTELSTLPSLTVGGTFGFGFYGAGIAPAGGRARADDSRRRPAVQLALGACRARPRCHRARRAGRGRGARARRRERGRGAGRVRRRWPRRGVEGAPALVGSGAVVVRSVSSAPCLVARAGGALHGELGIGVRVGVVRMRGEALPGGQLVGARLVRAWFGPAATTAVGIDLSPGFEVSASLELGVVAAGATARDLGEPVATLDGVWTSFGLAAAIAL